MSAVVAIVGSGLLADYVYEKLAANVQIVHQADFRTEIPARAGLALVLNDSWNPAVHRQAEKIFRSMGIPWLRAFVSFGEGIMGPLVLPGMGGCSQCADIRYLMAGRDRRQMWELKERLAAEETRPHDAWAAPLGLLQMASLIEEETEKILCGELARSESRVWLLNLRTLKSSWHSFLPDPECPACGQLPRDSPDAARISLKPSPKITPGSFRSRSMDDLKKVLVRDYLDFRTGFLNEKMYDLLPPFADVGVNLPLLIGDEGVAGRTHSYEMSELTAILEGLERYCGLSPRGKQTVVYDSYRNLQDRALNPVEVGVHAKEHYASPNFPFNEFDPDRPMSWVWAYSFLQERPLLVPERLAYYSLGCGEGFVYETSNGCALGGSLEEAIFHGIMEVVERDSFLMTWYARLPLPRLDPGSANDPELELMIDRVRAVAGYDLYLFSSTMEHGIPSVSAIAKNRKKKGLNIICAAGAHLDPIRAVKGAIHELAGMMLNLDDQFEANQEKYREMLRDSSLVRKMDDHGMLYALPEAEERLQFLLGNHGPLRRFSDEFNWKTDHSDLTDDLRDILQVFRKLSLDVIVVEQTTPEIKRNGLHCVKVLIPGMLPMTFGHHLTRTTGLERVLRVPMELGYSKEPLTPEKLNPYPHPFP